MSRGYCMPLKYWAGIVGRGHDREFSPLPLGACLSAQGGALGSGRMHGRAADLAVMGSGVAHDVFLLSYPKDPADETGYIGKRFLWRIQC